MLFGHTYDLLRLTNSVYFIFFNEIKGVQTRLSECIASTLLWMKDSKKIIVRFLTPTAMANGWSLIVVVVPIVMHRVQIMVIIFTRSPICVTIATSLVAATAAVAMVIHNHKDRIVSATVLIVMQSCVHENADDQHLCCWCSDMQRCRRCKPFLRSYPMCATDTAQDNCEEGKIY